MHSVAQRACVQIAFGPQGHGGTCGSLDAAAGYLHHLICKYMLAVQQLLIYVEPAAARQLLASRPDSAHHGFFCCTTCWFVQRPGLCKENQLSNPFNSRLRADGHVLLMRYTAANVVDS